LNRKSEESWFCMRVCDSNNIEFLRWVREVKQCAWDQSCLWMCVQNGNLEMVKYCCENKCPMDASSCFAAVQYGYFTILEYLFEKECPCDWRCLHVSVRDAKELFFDFLMKKRAEGWQEYFYGISPTFLPIQDDDLM